MSGSLNRIGAMVMRHWYLLRRSVPRLLEITFWPSFEIMIWGFVSIYMSDATGTYARAGQMMLGGVILWLVFVRGQVAVLISFLEETWSRNLGHLFVSPIRPWEFTVGILVVAAVRSFVGISVAMLLAVIFFNSEILSLGLLLPIYYGLLLMMSWPVGMTAMSLMLRYGQSTEWLIWMMGFLLMPISCVFYPLTTLPVWLQPLAEMMPTAHIFEGMRAALAGQPLQPDYLLKALGLDIAYLLLASWYLKSSIDYARHRAMLVQQGE